MFNVKTDPVSRIILVPIVLAPRNVRSARLIPKRHKKEKSGLMMPRERRPYSNLDVWHLHSVYVAASVKVP